MTRGGTVAVGLLVLGACQRLPGGSGGDDWDEEVAGTTLEPGGGRLDDGALDDSTGEAVDPTVCQPGLRARDRGVLSDFAGVEIIEGDLVLIGIRNRDLDWLQCVRHVEGSLSIRQSPTLFELSGLRRLRSVGGMLVLWRDPSLVDLGGLSGLTAVGEGIHISDDGELRSLAGLEQVYTEGELRIEGNALLEEVQLPRITRLEVLGISGNARLERLELPALREVEALALVDDPALEHLDGLASLERVTWLSLIELGALSTTGELTALREAERVLVRDSPGLVRLELPALQTLDELWLWRDPTLTELVLPSLERLGAVSFESLPVLVEPAPLGEVDVQEVALYDVPGITGLHWLGPPPSSLRELWLMTLPGLEELTWLESLTEIEGSLELRELPVELSLEPLSRLGEVRGSMRLDGLASIDGLVGLERVIGSLELRRLGSTDLGGLRRLRAAGGLTISGNATLTTLEGLERLQSIEGSLDVSDDPALTTLAAIWPAPEGGLQTVLGPQVRVRNNASLSQCEVGDFIGALLASGVPLGIDVGANLPCPE